MKFAIASLLMVLSLSATVYAEDNSAPAFDDQALTVMGTPKYDSPIGECDSIYDEDDLRECRNWRTCIARDAQRNRFVFTGSYGKPNKYIVGKAVEKCQAHSPNPSTCKVTVCRFGRY
jgi:hypothetical protein